MKNLIQFSTLILIQLLTLSSAWASTPLKFENMPGWKAEDVDKDSALRAIFAGSQYVFFVESQDAEERPIVRVREFKDAASLTTSSAKSWRGILFADKKQSQIVTSQKVFKKGDDFSYLAEFQTDTGTSTMLYSAVLGRVVSGKIIILTYEQRRDVYLKNISQIKQLFESITIAAASK